MTAALEGSEWSAARPDRTLPPGKTPYPFYRRLGGPQGRSGRAENLVPTGIRCRTVQPVVSGYGDWATRAIYSCSYLIYINGDLDDHLVVIWNTWNRHKSNAASAYRSSKIAQTTQTQQFIMNQLGASDVIQHIALNFPCSKRKHWRK